jgi:hypothetical protein
MKIFSMNDCDWMVGLTMEACRDAYLKDYGDCDSIDKDAHELSDTELDNLIFSDMDENEKLLGSKRTFREQLAIEIASGGVFPRLFASTEF